MSYKEGNREQKRFLPLTKVDKTEKTDQSV